MLAFVRSKDSAALPWLLRIDCLCASGVGLKQPECDEQTDREACVADRLGCGRLDDDPAARRGRYDADALSPSEVGHQWESGNATARLVAHAVEFDRHRKTGR